MPLNPALIARSARWTRWLAIAILAVTLVLQLSALFPTYTHLRMHAPPNDVLGRVLNFGHTVFMLLALVQLILMLRELERGELFSAGVTRRLRMFALFALLALSIGGIVAPMLSYAFPNCEPRVPCFRKFPIDMRVLWSLLVSLIFFLVARLIDEARRIDEDNRQII
jgi:MFS family permease